MRNGRGNAALIFGSIVTAGTVMTVLSPATANAADLTCSAPPGSETVNVDEAAACGVRTDGFGNAFARAIDGVAFARAEAAGAAFSMAQAGGVAAAETASGNVGAVSVGTDSVAIVSPDPGARALAVSLARGQTFVGTFDEGVRCDAGAGLAANLTTGQVCISDGITNWSSVIAVP